MGWSFYLFIIFLAAGAFFVVTAFVLNWAIKRGHFNHFQRQAESIFDDDEPEGENLDSFPKKRPKH